jgi:V8-like Glu-specific endopeptidase
MARRRKNQSARNEAARRKQPGRSRPTGTPAVQSTSGALFNDVRGRVDKRGTPAAAGARAHAKTKSSKRRTARREMDPGIDRLPAFDSWYAKYSSVTTRLMLAAEPRMRARVDAEAVIGRDDRDLVTNVKKFPFSAICFLKCVPRHRRHFYKGTGWLVGPRLLFTAGHNLHSLEDGGYMQSVHVYPARDGSQFDTEIVAQARDLRTTTVWERSNPNGSPFDIGAIVLPQAVNVRTFGFFGYEVLSASKLRGQRVMIAGYPGEKPNNMWFHERTVIGAKGNQLIYDADTSKGQSGAPVLYKFNDEWISIGVHNYGDATGNIATWVTDHVLRLFEEWQSEAGG